MYPKALSAAAITNMDADNNTQGIAVSLPLRRIENIIIAGTMSAASKLGYITLTISSGRLSVRSEELRTIIGTSEPKMPAVLATTINRLCGFADLLKNLYVANRW